MQTERMAIMQRTRCATALTCMMICAVPDTSFAQSPAQTFADKTINLIIGYPPGTGNDIYARLFARHIGRHILGQPRVVPQNMPGAGSYKAASYLYNAAPRDGTTLGFISQTAATEEVLGSPAVQFKTARFGWIGRISSYNLISLTWHTSKVKTIAEALKAEASIGASGVGSSLYIYPNVLNKVVGAKFKIVSGYQGSAEAFLAMERGEIEGVSTGWFTVKSTKQAWLDGNKINILVQYMANRHPDLPSVPSIVELARTAEERQLLSLFANEGEIGKAVFAPPGLPTSTLTHFRRAFDAMTKDREFIADAEKLQAERDAMSGEELQRLVEAVVNTPPAIVERAKSLLK